MLHNILQLHFICHVCFADVSSHYFCCSLLPAPAGFPDMTHVFFRTTFSVFIRCPEGESKAAAISLAVRKSYNLCTL